MIPEGNVATKSGRHVLYIVIPTHLLHLPRALHNFLLRVCRQSAIFEVRRDCDARQYAPQRRHVLVDGNHGIHAK